MGYSQGSVFDWDPNYAATVANNGTPSYTGVTLHTSSQALPIVIMWGTRRVSPNLIWASSIVTDASGQHPASFAAQPQDTFFNPFVDTDFVAGGTRYRGAVVLTGFGGGFGNQYYGNQDPNTAGCRTWVPMIWALCQGPIDLVTRIWNGGGQGATLWYNRDGTTTGSLILETSTNAGYMDNSNISPYIIGYKFTVGDSAQTAWNLFSAHPGLYPNQNLNYRNIALITSPLVDTGLNYTIPQQAYEVIRTPTHAYRLADSYGLGYDYSFADIIPDLLTNPNYGMGLVSADIDSTSLGLFLQYVIAQGLFFSPLLDAQASAVDILDRFASESNSWIFWSGTAFYFVPLGDESITANGQTYTPDTTPVYSLSYADFGGQGITVQRAEPADCFNRLRLEFKDRSNDYGTSIVEWKDTTLINLYGLRDASSFSADDICDVAVAAMVVELMGKRMAYIRNTYSFTLSYKYIRILPGTMLQLTDPQLGLNAKQVRVRSIEEDDVGNLAVVAEEYPGTLGISRALASQAWAQTGGTQSGNQIGTGTATGGNPTPTNGGTLVMDYTMTLVLFVAGDVITLPPTMVVGRNYVFVHDQQRSPQPAKPLLENNPATWNRPSGPTWTIANPNDGTLTPGTTFKIKSPSGLSFALVLCQDAIVRCLGSF